MKEYSETLLKNLNQGSQLVKVNEAMTVIKPIPDGDQMLSIYSRVLPEVLNMRDRKEHEENKGQKDRAQMLSEARAHMGGFNYNLNQVEIYTRYLEVKSSDGNIPVWVYYPRRMQGKQPAYIHIHGGAFFGGSPFAVENQCRLIAERANCVVFNVDYALAPEHPYPIPCNQVYAVLDYVYHHSDEFQVDHENIIMGGDSAGGNLTAVCAQMDRDKGTHYLTKEVLIYPKLTFTNHRLTGYHRDLSQFTLVKEQEELLAVMTEIGSDESNAGDEAVYVQGNYDITDPYISPAFGKCEGLPATLLILAEYDGLRLEGEFYAKQLQDAGGLVRAVRYCGICHGFYDKLGILPQTEDAVNEITAFIREK